VLRAASRLTACWQVRDLWPMPPQTEQRCGLFLRDECICEAGPPVRPSSTLAACAVLDSDLSHALLPHDTGG